jgi:hypothetical protein
MVFDRFLWFDLVKSVFGKCEPLLHYAMKYEDQKSKLEWENGAQVENIFFL